MFPHRSISDVEVGGFFSDVQWDLKESTWIKVAEVIDLKKIQSSKLRVLYIQTHTHTFLQIYLYIHS